MTCLWMESLLIFEPLSSFFSLGAVGLNRNNYFLYKTMFSVDWSIDTCMQLGETFPLFDRFLFQVQFTSLVTLENLERNYDFWCNIGQLLATVFPFLVMFWRCELEGFFFPLENSRYFGWLPGCVRGKPAMS